MVTVSHLIGEADRPLDPPAWPSMGRIAPAGPEPNRRTELKRKDIKIVFGMTWGWFGDDLGMYLE